MVSVQHPLDGGRPPIATSAERMRALRERERRGLRRLTIDVSEGDLRVIAEQGYEHAANTYHDQHAQAVGPFNGSIACRDRNG